MANQVVFLASRRPIGPVLSQLRATGIPFIYFEYAWSTVISSNVLTKYAENDQRHHQFITVRDRDIEMIKLIAPVMIMSDRTMTVDYYD
jgi:hypothetical protein